MLFSEAREVAKDFPPGTIYLHGADWEELVTDALKQDRVADDAFIHMHRGLLGGVRINDVYFRRDGAFDESPTVPVNPPRKRGGKSNNQED